MQQLDGYRSRALPQAASTRALARERYGIKQWRSKYGHWRWQRFCSTPLATGNTANGASALLHNDTGSFNTAAGNLALSNNITGTFNSGFGQGALASNTLGTDDAASGVWRALQQHYGQRQYGQRFSGAQFQ